MMGFPLRTRLPDQRWMAVKSQGGQLMWARSAQRVMARWLNTSGLVTFGVVVMVVLGTAGFVIGRGDSALHLTVSPGDAWLSTTQRGSVSLVDGQSGQSSAELLVNGARGHYLVVSQVGHEVLVLDTRTGMLIRINTVQLALGATARTPSGSVVVAGLAATYLVDYAAGTVQRIDPVTLSPLGPLVHVPGQLGPAAVVDGNGTLWMPISGNGTVVPVTSNGLGKAIPVGTSGADLVMTTAGGVPIAVDRTAHRLTTLALTGARSVLTLPASADASGSQALLVPAAGNSATLPLVNPNGAPSLVIVDLSQGTTRSVPLGAEVTGHTLGEPVQAGQRIFVPDYTTGDVLVYDSTAGALATTIPVTGRRGTFEAQVIDGIAYFNDPNGSQAVVVTQDGQVHQVRKTGPSVPTARRGPAPSLAPAPRTSPGPGPGNGPGSGQGSGQGSGGQPGNGHQPGNPAPPPPPKPKPKPKPRPKPKPTPSASVPALPPLAPQNPQVTSGPGYVDVSWQPPASGGPVRNYTVDVSPASAAAAQTPTGATSVRVSGLDCATVYSVTVNSVGSGGQTVPAQPVTVRPCVPPAAPQGLGHTVSSHQIQVNWAAPASNGGGPVSYTVTWNGGSQPGLTGTSFRMTGLANFQNYNVSVTAANAAGGGGAASAAVNLSPGQTWGYNIIRNPIDPVAVRAAPSAGNTATLGSFGAGSNAPVQVICQVTGGYYQDPGTPPIPAGDIWDKIVYGGGAGYVGDGYVTTLNSLNNAFSPPIWQC
jgi:Fibronectin type III domain